MDTGYWGSIPNNILENILCEVPTHLLPLNKPWVFKKWTEINLNPQFWKKKLRINGIVIENFHWAELKKHWMSLQCITVLGI